MPSTGMNLLSEITIGQYQQLYAIEKQEGDEFEKSLQRVAVITGMTDRELEDMPLMRVNEIAKGIRIACEQAVLNNSPVDFLKSGNKIYQVQYMISRMRAAQYSELQTWLNGDIIENLHKILASIVVPVKKWLWVYVPGKNDSAKHPEVSEHMKDVNFNDAYGCVVFFCRLYNALIKDMQGYLELQLVKKMSPEEAKKLMGDLMKVMDGFTIPNELRTSRTLS